MLVSVYVILDILDRMEIVKYVRKEVIVWEEHISSNVNKTALRPPQDPCLPANAKWLTFMSVIRAKIARGNFDFFDS